MVVYSSNPSSWEAEADLCMRPAWSIEDSQSYTKKHMSKKKKIHPLTPPHTHIHT